MNDLLAYCGTYCGACPVYWATREPDKIKQWRMREGIANCAPCAEYPCGDLLAQFAWDRTAEDRLELLRSLAGRD